MYVSDYKKKCVWVFTSEGKLVTSFEVKHSNFSGLAVDSSGVVYVCDETKGIQLL